MMASPPGSPAEGAFPRSQSMQGSYSPDVSQRSRPQSMIGRPIRSQSRVSQSSKQATSKSSDEDRKTSVKVVVRVRPPLGPSDPGYDLIPLRFQRSTVRIESPTTLAVDAQQGRKIFIFDRVFAEDVSQNAVWDYLEDSVDSFLQGYNVSILAYGQSGSGKSYTMGTSGAAEQTDPATRGVIPRAASHLFAALASDSGSLNRQNSGLRTPNRYSTANTLSYPVLQSNRIGNDKSWEVSVTYVEIYNEQPRDLLLDEATPANQRASVQIREDQRGRIFVEGLRSVRINSIEDLMSVLNFGSAIRQTDATAINAKSSRSHAVFTIILRQTKPQGTMSPPKRSSVIVDSSSGSEDSMTVESKLHFVDLAGSERLKNTGATGDRAKEGISINAGLASLGKVISQLSSRSSGFVSYRDSKLTRMLQDSLGGQAITYMIACVTPAEFHLSETLNTVQYAQRARNIQTKPQIQQIDEDSDKQAVIERLRSEVAFLRQQIRSADGGARDKSDRPSERDFEMQNHLLDVQESYSALSQRHAKLIAEMTKAADPTEQVSHFVGDSANDRLKRSQAHQQQIEQVVLEYEKTIQALEGTLSTTRSSLANSESSLMERESKCAYLETTLQQLQARAQKLMDRDSSNETYLHNLEARLAEQNTGGEKSNAIIADLQKRISDLRESGTTAEEYITTLEERLTEADHDMDIMSREVERLEQLVERQRSLGKLDNLLYELDHAQKEGQATNAISRSQEAKSPEDVELPLAAEDELEEVHDEQMEPSVKNSDSAGLDTLTRITAASPKPLTQIAGVLDASTPSPAQTKFVTEKFETITQELFDVKLEHESTLNEFDLLSAKYQQALRTLAEMQESFEAKSLERESDTPDALSRPPSFLDEVRMQGRTSGELPSSRSLSSELSSAGDSATSVDPSDITPLAKRGDVESSELLRLRALLEEHEQNAKTTAEQYAALQAEHKESQSTIERLRGEVSRHRPLSPNTAPGLLRRASSQAGSAVDRGQRSILALRTLVVEELVNKPDQMESAEVHLSAATHELQARTDRVQALENELKNVRKEMEMKSTIISGLTRERNSVKSGTPVDLSMVSQLRDQLIQKETELRDLHESYAKREQNLHDEIQCLSRRSSAVSSPVVGSHEHAAKYKSLEAQFDYLSEQHVAAQLSVQDKNKQLAMVTTELDTMNSMVETLKKQLRSTQDPAIFARREAAAAMQEELNNYESIIARLKQELETHESTTTAREANFIELQQLYKQAELESQVKTKDLISASSKVKQHQARATELEKELEKAQSAVEFHKHGLKSLHDAHATEVEELKLSHAAALATLDDQISARATQHEGTIKELSAAKDKTDKTLEDILQGAKKALGYSLNLDMLSTHIQDLADEKRHFSEANARLVGTNSELERQLNGRQNLVQLEEQLAASNHKIGNYQETIKNLANELGDLEETLLEQNSKIKKHETEMTTLKAEKQQKMSLIEELEQQLQTSYDSSQNRLSQMQSQTNQALVDAQQRIVSLEKELETVDPSRSNTMRSTNRPGSPYNEQNRTNSYNEQNRSNSLNSNLRKSASIASLPSPPPSMPLPPLPSLPGLSINSPSPPNSRHTSREGPPLTPTGTNFARISSASYMSVPQADPALAATIKQQSTVIDEQESRIRTIDKHLNAEKQLTATLEEALVDLETQSNKLRVDAENWKKKAWAMEEELSGIRKERRSERLSVQAVEEEVRKRQEAELARKELEERMRVLMGPNEKGRKKRKGGGLNCF